MLKEIFLGSALVISPALAQTASHHESRQILTPAEWKSMFIAKADSFAVAKGTTANSPGEDEAGPFATPADYLSPGQTKAQLLAGTIDATPAINAAIATKQSVYLPCGTYLIASGPIKMFATGDAIVGANAHCVIFYDSSTTGDTIDVGNGVTVPFNVRISGVDLYAGRLKTSGAALNVKSPWNFQADSFVVSGTYFDGVLLRGNDGIPLTGSPKSGTGFGYRLSNFEIQTASAVCMDVTAFAQDVFLSNGLFGTVPAASCATGLDLHDVGGFYASNVDIIAAAGVGFTINPSASLNQSVFAVYLSNFLADTSYGNNIYFSGDGPVTEIHLNGVWASSSGTGDGFSNTNPNLDGLTAVDFEAVGNYADGVGISGGKNIVFTGLRSVMNNITDGGSYNGISISDGDQITITAAKLGGGGIYTAPIRAGHRQQTVFVNHQVYGAVIKKTVTNLIFTGNQASGNIIAGCSLPTASTTIIRTDNIGSGCN